MLGDFVLHSLRKMRTKAFPRKCQGARRTENDVFQGTFALTAIFLPRSPPRRLLAGRSEALTGEKKCDLPDDVSCEVLRPLETDVGCCERGDESDDGQNGRE